MSIAWLAPTTSALTRQLTLQTDYTRPLAAKTKLESGLKETGRWLDRDFLVLKDVWDAAHPAPPQLMGQLLHLFDAPNRFGLPAFYTLHVWAWKQNPNGTFVNWHPRVSCDAFGDADGVSPDRRPDALTKLLSKSGSRKN